MHVAFSLLTLFPGRVGGSESNVKGLLREFSAGNGPERVTVLANPLVMDAYRDSPAARSASTSCGATGRATAA